MDSHKVATSNSEIDAAIAAARKLGKEPRAVSVEYAEALHLLIVKLDNGRRLAFPVEEVQGLAEATAAQLAEVELLGGGTGIGFPALDVDLYVPALAEGVYGNRAWMARLGRKGGKARSEAKRAASRSNGAKGGRPRKAA